MSTRPATARELAIGMWMGAALEPCSPRHRDAVTIQGVIERMAHDLGLHVDHADVMRAIVNEGIRVEGERLDRSFASTWTQRARASFGALYGAACSGGR